MAKTEITHAWLARDKSCTLRLYAKKPVKKEISFLATEPHQAILLLPTFFFPEITWENSPQRINLILSMI